MKEESKFLERHSNVLGKEGKFKYNGRTYYYDIPTMSNIEIYDDKRKRVQDLVEEEHSNICEYLLVTNGYKATLKDDMVIYTHPNDYFAFVTQARKNMSMKFYNSLRDAIHKKNYTIHCLNKMVEELKEELNSLKSEYNAKAKEVRENQTTWTITMEPAAMNVE